MRQRVREFAWADTVLGAIDCWPQALRTVVDVALGCAFPQIVVWGPELIQIYNDAYRELIGAKHPAALGQPTREFRPELWPINGPLFDRVLKAETVSFKDDRYEFQRHDEMEVAYFSASYSPIRGDDGLVQSVLCTLLETTLGVDQLARVFDPFVQVDRHLAPMSQQGVGLGLAISRDLASGMGGSLDAASEEGRGSAFTLTLPRVRGARARIAPRISRERTRMAVRGDMPCICSSTPRFPPSD